MLFCFFAVVLSFYKKRVCGWLGSSCRFRYNNIQKILVYGVMVCVFVIKVYFGRVFD